MRVFPHRIYSRKLPAFSLTELLVVLVIIGILVLLALPDQSSVISKAKATEAKLQLEHLHSLEQTFFYEYSRYTNSLDEVGFQQAKNLKQGGNANYRIEVVEASANSFKARAIAEVDFDQDGVFNEWEIDHEKQLKETVKD